MQAPQISLNLSSLFIALFKYPTSLQFCLFLLEVFFKTNFKVVLTKKFTFLKNLFKLSLFLWICMCTCLRVIVLGVQVSEAARRGHQIPRSWSLHHQKLPEMVLTFCVLALIFILKKIYYCCVLGGSFYNSHWYTWSEVRSSGRKKLRRKEKRLGQDS